MYEIIYFQTSEQVTRVSTDPSFFSFETEAKKVASALDAGKTWGYDWELVNAGTGRPCSNLSASRSLP